jgi:hypothetical protein
MGSGCDAAFGRSRRGLFVVWAVTVALLGILLPDAPAQADTPATPALSAPAASTPAFADLERPTLRSPLMPRGGVLGSIDVAHPDADERLCVEGGCAPPRPLALARWALFRGTSTSLP